MFEVIKDFLKNLMKSRLFVLAVIMVVLCLVLLQRVFVLQIVNGSTYQENYQLKIKKERTINSARGNIYDRNGELLAYNELAYSVTIEDNGSYENNKEKNSALNEILYKVLQVLDANGDSISNSFGIFMNENGDYEYMAEGSSRLRFLADVYGYATVDEFKEKCKDADENTTAAKVMEDLGNEKRFDIKAGDYEKKDYYRLVVLRYALSQYSFSRYVITTIAENVSEKTVAYIKENSDELQGVDIAEDTVRRYVDSEYFAHIIGYTGKISPEEYEELSKDNEHYTLNDVVGKSGMEQVMESELQGKKGLETVYVDNMGKVIEVTERSEPTVGNDVYLSIDKKMTQVIYRLIEQQLAGILYSKIQNIRSYDTSSASASDIQIPIYDVYFATINNNMIDILHFAETDASSVEKEVEATFQGKQQSVLNEITALLNNPAPVAFTDLDEEMKDYITYIMTMLRQNKILDNSVIDKTDETYLKWREGALSLNEYLDYCIAKGWLDTSGFETGSKYSDSDEMYQSVINYIIENIAAEKKFSKLLYKYLIKSDAVSGTQLGMILYDQGVLAEDAAMYAQLSSGSVSAYTFFKEKIRTLEITPAQLALDPCSASCVVTDVNTGELLACVTYPGYDNNRLANSVDSDYFASLNDNLALPLYNYATQQKTAPGSTFKMLVAAAGLTEGVISTGEQITDEGIFEKETPSPRCWLYTQSHTTHGSINVSEAIRDSCNYFFYETGYRMSLSGGAYNDTIGLEKLHNYAELFGLNSKTGIEIPESEPKIADEYPIRASIGQSNNAYTTTELARYVTAVANSGTVYKYTLLNKVTDSDGNVLQEFKPQVERQITEISDTTWAAIHSGMRMVVESHKEFNNFPVAVAGKTGTAQEDQTRANHALFLSYAPYENPQISVATRIAFGYSSSNAADLTSKVLSYCLNIQPEEQLITNSAADVDNTANSFAD
ncbi:MAG: peptidoglycan glycosyltransferase [Eubacterium sp.]|nr:peptidoglycan glycosyltransferase [Eubacterium sp.]